MRGSGFKRKLDHYVGSPFLLTLSWLRSKRDVPANSTTYGILSCSAIGDTIVASAIARDLKAKFPGCKVVVFISTASHGVASLVDGYDEEVRLPISRPLWALRVMHAHPVDVLIDIMPWPRMTALITALAGARFTIGFRTPYQHRHFAYDAAVSHLSDRHELDNIRALLLPLGIAGTSLPRASQRLTSKMQPAVGGLGEVVLHPWASGFRSAMREWAVERWADLARSLIAEGANITITGGPADRDRALTLARMIGLPDRVTILAGSTSLLQTAEHMTAADVVVTVNTGTMHLAAALGLNVVALHGPTDPVRWGPLSRNAVVVGPGRNEGGAYLNLGFEYPSDAVDCMRQITVEEVRGHVYGFAKTRDRQPEAQSYSIAPRRAAARAQRQPVYSPEGDLAPTTRTYLSLRKSQGLSSRRGTAIKRIEDVVLASILVVLTLPLMLLIAAAIRIESPGPVLFRQHRYGYKKRLFRVCKFRTMYVGAEDKNCTHQTTRGDRRVTKVGAILRRHSLDELPQIFNVLAGGMSLVGPRPHAIMTNVDGILLEDLTDAYFERHSVKPGITGWAQVNGWRGPIDCIEKLAKRIEHDLFYIANWSLMLDFKILLRTARRAWHDDAAY